MKNSDEEMINMIKKTFKAHQQLSHNNIIKAEELFINEDKETVYYVMELVEWPSLKDFMKVNKGTITEK